MDENYFLDQRFINHTKRYLGLARKGSGPTAANRLKRMAGGGSKTKVMVIHPTPDQQAVANEQGITLFPMYHIIRRGEINE